MECKCQKTNINGCKTCTSEKNFEDAKNSLNKYEKQLVAQSSGLEGKKIIIKKMKECPDNLNECPYFQSLL